MLARDSLRQTYVLGCQKQKESTTTMHEVTIVTISFYVHLRSHFFSRVVALGELATFFYSRENSRGDGC